MELEKIKKGDAKAYGKWIEKNKQYLYHIAIAIVENEEEAGDAISETILKSYTHIKELKKAEYLKTWITRILINECRKILKQKGKIVSIENYQQQQTNTYIVEEQKEEEMDLKHAIEKLNKKQKDVIMLYYYNDLSIKSIADILEIPQGTVKSRLDTAKKYLYEILLEERGEHNG